MTLALLVWQQDWGSVMAYLPMGIFAGCIIAIVATMVGRARGLRKAARVHGWTWLSNDPPWDLPFREICNQPTGDIEFKNVFSGTQNGLEFVACDCIFGAGRYRTITSIVAVRSPHNPFGTELLGENSIVHSGDWWAIRAGAPIVGSIHRIGVAETVAIVESIVSAGRT